MDNIRRIPVAKLQLGMYVSDETPNLEDGSIRPKGFIRRHETIDKLLAKGINEVFIDIYKGLDSPYSIPLKSNTQFLSPKIALQEERDKAASVYNEARSLVSGILRDVKLGKLIDIEQVECLADEINGSVLNNPNALLCLSAIREKDQYLLEHSINVGVIMGIFTRYLGYEDELVHQLVTGALLHDIGKVRVPHHILHKPGRLSGDEWTEMKRHVVYGQEILLKSPGVTDVTLAICGLHHERLNGSGYPIGLDESNINSYGRLAAIVDVYDALTADRVYHQGRPPADALRFMLDITGGHLDRGLVNQFIRCMSVYPVSTLVELDNNRAAVVISSNYTKPHQPTVRTIYNLRQRHYEKSKDIDLSSPLIEQKIIGTLDPRDYDIQVRDFL
ncbi:HD-GYP domain-containing protein [Teredinibacter turnerae]|uniref:HD-GYP domain-containing protein n=1 Tax=Teredinibacter turnerae TaxID=2426 RepID=UPI00037B9986|nr:HD-GYP domain-containing protein [Teredinibacter turnerae]